MNSSHNILTQQESLEAFLNSLDVEFMCPPNGPAARYGVASMLRCGAYGILAAVVGESGGNPFYTRGGIEYTAAVVTHHWDTPYEMDYSTLVDDQVGRPGNVVCDNWLGVFRLRLPRMVAEEQGAQLEVPFGHSEILASILQYNRKELY